MHAESDIAVVTPLACTRFLQSERDLSIAGMNIQNRQHMHVPERRVVPADVAVVHAYCAVVLEEIVEGGRAAKIIIFNTQFLVFDT